MLKHPVPSKLLEPLGEMIVLFALLENEIQSLMGSLIREHQRVGQIIASNLSFSKLRAVTISFYLDRHGEDDDFRKVKDLISKAGKIEEERNRISHSIWGAGSSADSITRLKIIAREKRGFQLQGEEYDYDKFHNFNISIRELVEEFMSLHHDLLSKGKICNNPGKKMW